MATHWTLGCDADDPQRIAAFWALALGYVREPGFDEPDNASIVDPDGRGPAIGFLKVPEGRVREPRDDDPESVRRHNRLHFDIRVGAENHPEVVAKLIARGAMKLWDGRQGPHTWVTMADPEGNEFCVA
ncbi:VOC family protein [Micromonospora sp. NPDC047707]|uniref:VOC family protein n=1 Tax=unclassified Micromonospora TaxID=2617518 RepID=UPI0012B4534D|nr:VOC family protein [Micromonospora sp. WMMC415]QGN47622.1 VOC family protein [Micromonospora sp. WMMC415]